MAKGKNKKAGPGWKNVFYQTRKPGKFSPKSKMFFAKAGPTFSEMTDAQMKVKEAGTECGQLIRGRLSGSGHFVNRKLVMGACIRSKFGKATQYDKDLLVKFENGQLKETTEKTPKETPKGGATKKSRSTAKASETPAAPK